MNYIDTQQKALKVRKLYRSGKKRKEIEELMKISKATYYVYWRILGGKNPEDEAIHHEAIYERGEK